MYNLRFAGLTINFKNVTAKPALYSEFFSTLSFYRSGPYPMMTRADSNYSMIACEEGLYVPLILLDSTDLTVQYLPPHKTTSWEIMKFEPVYVGHFTGFVPKCTMGNPE